MGWLWYLGTLIPVIGLVQAGNQAMADRFAYIPLIGIYTAGVWLLFDVAETRRLHGTALTIVAVVVVVLACSSRIQTGYWRDSMALFTRATAVTEKNFLAWNNLGVAYAERGKLAEAISCYRKSIEIRPDFPHSWYNLGAAELALGDALRAIPPFQEAARLRPANPKAWNSLGVAFARAGQWEPAVECYREAIRLQRDFPGAWYNLGLAYLRMELPFQAVDCFRETLRLQPGHSGAEKKLDEIQGMGGRAFPLTGPVSGEAGRGR
jgi:tetratricopeptide (TPR) repeat protein